MTSNPCWSQPVQHGSTIKNTCNILHSVYCNRFRVCYCVHKFALSIPMAGRSRISSAKNDHPDAKREKGANQSKSLLKLFKIRVQINKQSLTSNRDLLAMLQRGEQVTTHSMLRTKEIYSLQKLHHRKERSKPIRNIAPELQSQPPTNTKLRTLRGPGTVQDSKNSRTRQTTTSAHDVRSCLLLLAALLKTPSPLPTTCATFLLAHSATLSLWFRTSVVSSASMCPFFSFPTYVSLCSPSISPMLSPQQRSPLTPLSNTLLL